MRPTNQQPLQRDEELVTPGGQVLSVLDAFHDPCVLLSKEGVVIAANTGTAQVLHCSNTELVGKPLAGFLDPSTRPEFLAAFARCVADGARQFCRAALRLPDGGRDVEISLSLCEPSAAAARWCLVVLRDITEDKQKDIDLLRFSNVAHYTLNPLEITDTKGRIIYVNPAFEQASGYGKEDLIGKNPNVFGSGKHPKSFWEEMWKTITSGNVWVGEVENKRRSGEPFLTHLLISPIVDRTGNVAGYFGIHRDITDQRRLEHQLFQAQKMESIGTLAAGVAHEVGNPLTSISSLVQVIQRTTEDDFTKEKLDLIKHQVTRISKIIRDLVDFSRPSSYEARVTDINKCIRQAVDIVRVGKKSRSITFDVRLDPSLPSLHLVPDQVEQVLINILINAVDAVSETGQRGPHGGTIAVSSRVEGEYVQIILEDNGRGMSAEETEKIFEPFFTTKGVGEGTGLGLWVSYGIVKSFHGQIRVDSTPGRGSIFTILLPLHSNY